MLLLLLAPPLLFGAVVESAVRDTLTASDFKPLTTLIQPTIGDRRQ
jgi:hypothetical protein